MSNYWTNESVLEFADGRDPLEAIEEAAQQAVFRAIEAGWRGPPFDPFELAEIFEIDVIPRNELREARTVQVGADAVAIEYNPSRPRHRVRFSIAHEIAHTLFGDVAREPRYRHNPAEGPPDGWQLEMLCNVAAAELLMPTEVLGELGEKPLPIEDLMGLRATFGVSAEVLLRRATKLASYPVAMFAAARTNPDSLDSEFRIDYTVPSPAWKPEIGRGKRLPADSVLSECTAVGFTAKREEDWTGSLRGVTVQAVGTPPFPGQRLPRVLGWLTPHGVARTKRPGFEVLHGDATVPRGTGERLIVHLVNDRTANWGGQFAIALRDRYPETQEDFREWVAADDAHLQLGAARIASLGGGVSVASLVAQRGYGPSAKPRIRYGALREALEIVAQAAKEAGASIHMPKIGAGQAGGRWPVVREIIEETLIRGGIPVTVYVPPGQSIAEEPDPYTALQLDL
jgi:hypothetical protein